MSAPVPPPLADLLAELGLDPARATLSRRPGRQPRAYLCLPSPGRPQLLVPLVPAAGDVVTERRSAGWRGRITKGLVATGLRSGVAPWLPVRRLVVTDPALDDLARWITGDDRAHLGVLSGPPRANRKPVLRVLAPSGRTTAYAKLGGSALTSELVRRETAALRSLGAAQISGLRPPDVLKAGEWAGRAVLVTSPLATGTALRQPDRLPVAQTRALFGHAARDDLPLRASSVFADRSAGPSPELDRLGARLLSVVGDLRLPVGAAHGDWTPWNMALDGDLLEVWDWERYAEDVPAGLDAVHFEASLVTVDSGFAGETRFLAQLPGQLERCGVDPEARRLLLPLYLYAIGRRYAADLALHHADRASRRLAWVTGLLRRQLATLSEGARP